MMNICTNHLVTSSAKPQISTDTIMNHMQRWLYFNSVCARTDLNWELQWNWEMANVVCNSADTVRLNRLAGKRSVQEKWGRRSSKIKKWKATNERYRPVNSLLTLCRSAGQELLTVTVGAAMPWLLYTSRRFPETGSCWKPTTTH